MAVPDVIVIGASHGGIEALQQLCQRLPPQVPAAIFVVVHTSPNSPGLLAEILANAGPLPASFGRHDKRFTGGHIYVAPPDHHMLIEAPDQIRLSRGPKENGFRPAIDTLFRSAALGFSPRVIGVILSGNLDDGTVGLAAIKRRGGIAMVQNPSEARVPSMPLSALQHVNVDHCLDIAQMAPRMMNSLRAFNGSQPQPMEIHTMDDTLKYEVRMAALSPEADPTEILKFGEASLFTCPDCHGSLVELREQGPLRFRCHTGHAFTADSLVASLSESTEEALWSTFRALQEKIMLLRHMATHARERNDEAEAKKLLRQAHRIQTRGSLVRQALLLDEATVSPDPAERSAG